MGSVSRAPHRTRAVLSRPERLPNALTVLCDVQYITRRSIMASWSHTWGTTAAERASRFPCDDLIARPDASYYRGVTIHAPPAVTFRWLCQLRVAPYSYDWIDNRGRRSPQHLTPGLEHLQLGQDVMTIFELVDFAPDRHLTMRIKRTGTAQGAFGDIAVSYLLVADGARACRLLVKLVARYPRGLRGHIMRRLLPWGDLVMMRRQLLNLKRLAERTTADAARRLNG